MSRIESLRTAFTDDPADDSAFLSLFRELVEIRDLEELVEVYRTRAAAVDPKQALYLYLTVAEVWSRRLGMPGLATEALFAAYELQPEAADLRERLRRHLETQRDWTMLARLLDREARNAPAGEERGRALLAFGHFLQEKLHDTTEAARTYLRAADESPESHTAAVIALQRLRREEANNSEVTRALNALLGQGPNPDDLIRALEEELQKIPADHTQRVAEHLCQLARVQLEGLGDTAKAQSLLEEAWKTDRGTASSIRDLLKPLVEASPDAGDSRRLLRVIQTELGNLEEARKLAEDELSTANDRERAMLLLDLARIHEQMEHPDTAALHYLDAYRADHTLSDSVRTALSALFEKHPGAARVRARYADFLEAESDTDGLADLWTQVAEGASGEVDRAEALWHRGRIENEQKHQPEVALQTWLKAAELGDDQLADRLIFDVFELYEHKSLRDEVVDALRTLAPSSGRWQLLCNALSQHADQQDDDRKRAALLRELGEIIEVQQRDPARALTAYRSAFRIAPDDLETVTRLRRVYQELGDHDQAATLLDMELRLAEDPDARAKLQAERAAMQSERGDVEGAVAALGDVLTFDESNQDAVAMVRKILSSEDGQSFLRGLAELPAGEETTRLSPRVLRTLGSRLAEEDDAGDLAGRLLFASLRGKPEGFDQFDVLIDLLEQTDDPLLLADALQWRIRTSGDHPVRLASLKSLETLAESRPDVPQLSERLQRTRLEVEPSPERFEELRSNLEKADNHEGLAELFLWAADHAPWVLRGGASSRIEMLHAAGEIYDEALDDPEAQDAVYRRVLDLNRNDTRALAHFRERLADDALAFYQILAPAAPAARSPEDRARCQAELAALSQDSIGDLDRAIFHWNQVLGTEDVPEKYREQAFSALRNIYLARDRRQELMDLVSAQVSSTSDPRVKADYLWELVTLQREASHDLTGARRTLNRILKLVPDEARALASLVELEHRAGNHDAAAGHLERLTEVTEGEDQRRHRFRLARLYREQLDRWQDALEVLHSELKARPGFEKALRELRKLLLQVEDDRSEEERRERLNAWLEIVEEQLELCEEDTLRMGLKLERAHVLTQSELLKPDHAIEAWLAVLGEQPDHREAVLALGALYEEEARWDEAISLYRGHATSAALDDEEKAGTWIRVAKAQRSGRGDANAAADALESALELIPGHPEALQELLSTSADLNTSRRLSILEDLVDKAEGENKIPYLSAIADVHEAEGNLKEVADVLSRMVELDPLDESHLERQRAVYEALGETGELAAVLGRLAGLTVDDEKKKALLVEQADLFEKKLDDPASAISAHETVINEFPRHVPSLEALSRLHRTLGNQTAALTALESLIRANPDSKLELLLQTAQIYGEELELPDEAFARYQWCHELAPEDERPLLGMWKLARQDGLWSDLIEVLEADALNIEDPEKQAELLMEVAQLTEQHLGDLHRSFHILRLAHQSAPSSGQLIQELERVAETGGHWLDLAVVYRGLADGAEGRDGHIKYLHRVADITATRLDNPHAAFDVLLEILDEYPDDAATVERLETLADHHGLWEELREFKLERAGDDRVEKKAALIGAAELSIDRLDDPADATRHLLAALELDPLDVDVLDRIAGLPGTDKDTWQQVLAVLRKNAFDDPRQRTNLALIQAEILETRLDDLGAAFDALLNALEDSPLDDQLFELVKAHGGQLNRLVEAATLLSRLLDDTLDRERALSLLDRKAELLELAGDVPGALSTLRRILELDPTHPDAADRIKTMSIDAENAGEVLRTLEVQAERLTDPPAQRDKYIEIAQLLESLDRVVEAADWYEKAVKRTPDHADAHYSLLRVSKRLERWDRSAEVLEAILKLKTGFDQRSERLELAEIYAKRLNQPDAVARVLSPLVDGAGDADAHRQLEEVYKSRERWSDLLKLYETRAEQTDDADEKRRCLLALAELAVDHFRNMPKALQALEPLMAPGQPRERDVLERVARLYGALGRWHDAVDVQLQLVDLLDDGEQRANALEELGRMQAEELEDLEGALETWSRLSDERPDDPTPWQVTGQALVDLKRPVDAVAAWVEAAGRQLPEDAAQTWYQIGVLRRDKLEQEEPARTSFEHALELDPRHRRAASALRTMVSGGPDAGNVLNVLEIELEQATSDSERASVLWRMAEIQRDDLNQDQDAEETLERAARIAPQHYAVRRDLADLYYSRGAWSEAREEYQRLTSGKVPRKGEAHELETALHRLNHYEAVELPDRVLFLYRLGQCLEKLDELHEALTVYNSIRDYQNLPGLRLAQARCTYKTGNWTRARKLFDELVTSDADLLDRDRASINYYFGDILHGAEQLDEALECFERALAADPSYRPAADQRLAILIEQKRWDETEEAFVDLMALTRDDEVRGAISKRLGELYEYFLDRPEDAIIAYEQSMVLGGDVFDVPERLLRLYVLGEHWEKARVLAETLVQEQDASSESRVEYLIVLGDILAQGLNELDAALKMYEQAFEADTGNLLALERIGRLHAQLHDEDAMGDRYQSFLRRLAPEDVETRAEVLGRYGDQLLDLLDAPDAAIKVYHELENLTPDDPRVHRRLAGLYAHEDVRDRAGELSQLRSLVRLGEAEQADFQRIGDLYEELGEEFGRDAVRSLLHFLDGSDEPPASAGRLPAGILSGEVFERYVVEDYAAGHLGELFVQLSELSGDIFKQQLSDLQLGDLEELTGHKSTPSAAIFEELIRALDLPFRRLIASRDLNVPIKIINNDPPAIVVSRETLKGLMGQELRYFLASALALTTPRFLMATSLGPFELLTVIRTLFGELSRSRTPPAKPSMVERETQQKVRRFLRELRTNRSVEIQENLESIVEQVLRSHHNEAPSARRYVQAARATGIRVGLLACGHQVAALKRILKDHHSGKSLYRPRDFDAFTALMEDSPDLRSLVAYIVSAEYVEAQRQVGRTTGSSQSRPDVPEPLLTISDAEPAPVPDVLAPREAPEGLNTDFLGGWEDIAAEAVAALDQASEQSGLFQMPDLGHRDDNPALRPKMRVDGRSSTSLPALDPSKLEEAAQELRDAEAARKSDGKQSGNPPEEAEADAEGSGTQPSSEKPEPDSGTRDGPSRITAPPTQNNAASFDDLLNDVIELAQNDEDELTTQDDINTSGLGGSAGIRDTDLGLPGTDQSNAGEQNGSSEADTSSDSALDLSLARSDDARAASTPDSSPPPAPSKPRPGPTDTDLGAPKHGDRVGGPPPSRAASSPSTISDVIELDELDLDELDANDGPPGPPPPPPASAVPAAQVLSTRRRKKRRRVDSPNTSKYKRPQSDASILPLPPDDES